MIIFPIQNVRFIIICLIWKFIDLCIWKYRTYLSRISNQAIFKGYFLATEYLVGIELKVNSNVKVNSCKILSFKGKPSSDQNFMYSIQFSGIFVYNSKETDNWKIEYGTHHNKLCEAFLKWNVFWKRSPFRISIASKRKLFRDKLLL